MHAFKDRKSIGRISSKRLMQKYKWFLYRSTKKNPRQKIQVYNNLVGGFHFVDSQYVTCSVTKALVLLVCVHQVGIRIWMLPFEKEFLTYIFVKWRPIKTQNKSLTVWNTAEWWSQIKGISGRHFLTPKIKSCPLEPWVLSMLGTVYL